MRHIIALLFLLLVTPACAQAPSEGLISKLESLAAKNNAEALYHLGMSYQTGTGVALDHRRALGYFERAKALGDALAAYKIGCFYAGQDDVLPIDRDKALANKLVAAQAGYALAQQDVAAIYADRGDAKVAGEWIARAAAQGTRDAFFGYASIHNGKNGLPRDAAAVVAYFSMFLGDRNADPGQREWLIAERAKLTAAEARRAAQIEADYRAKPTEITLRALAGQRAAELLAERNS